MADVVETLHRVPLFAGVKDRDVRRLAKVMSERTFQEGEPIMTEGQSGIGFFVIEEWNATVSLRGETLRTVGPGDYICVPGGLKHWSGGDEKEGAVFYQSGTESFDLIKAAEPKK